MKKIVSFLLLTALAVSLFGTAAFFAADQEPVDVSLSSGKGYVGDVVSVVLSIGPGSNAGNGHFKIFYDSEKLSYDGYEETELSKSAMTVVIDNGDHIGIGFASVGNITAGGEFVRLEFRITGTEEGVENVLDLEVVELVNGGTEENIAAAVTDGVIKTMRTPTAPPPKPEAPAIVSVSSVSAQISWTDIDEAEAYLLYLDGEAVSGTPVTGTSYTLTGLSPKTEYSVTIAAVNKIGISEQGEPLVFETAAAGKGDVNFDGKVNISDALITFLYCAGKTELDDAALAAANVNSDDKVNIADAMLIFQFVAGKVSF